jgi:acylphosphatase
MKTRGTFIVDGVVQGVGYREEVQSVAHELGLTGTVRNLGDGRVRIIAEGDEGVLRTFQERINIVKGRIRVEEIISRCSKGTGQFRRFRIDRGPNISNGELELMEKLDKGYYMMEDMNARLSGKMDITNESIREVGTDVKAVGTDVKAVGTDVKAMDNHMSDHFQRLNSNMSGHFKSLNSNMSGHFGRLDRKYGDFGKTMKGVAKDIKAIRKAASPAAAAPPLRRPRRKTSSAGTA